MDTNAFAQTPVFVESPTQSMTAHSVLGHRGTEIEAERRSKNNIAAWMTR